LCLWSCNTPTHTTTGWMRYHPPMCMVYVMSCTTYTNTEEHHRVLLLMVVVYWCILSTQQGWRRAYCTFRWWLVHAAYYIPSSSFLRYGGWVYVVVSCYVLSTHTTHTDGCITILHCAWCMYMHCLLLLTYSTRMDACYMLFLPLVYVVSCATYLHYHIPSLPSYGMMVWCIGMCVLHYLPTNTTEDRRATAPFLHGWLLLVGMLRGYTTSSHEPLSM
jgi:hypothetical protein